MVATQKKTLRSTDGTEIYYETYIAGGAQPLLFFVHGIGGDLDGWQFVRNILLEKGISSVALDLRGHGFSGHPSTMQGYAVERIEEDIRAIIEKENLGKVVLVGHSGGAVIAAKFAAHFPHLLSGLVLVNGSYCPPAYLQSPLLRAVANGIIRTLALISLPWMGPWHSPYPPGKHHKEVEVYGLLRTIFHNSLRSYLYTSYALVNLDLRNELKNITAPTLLIAGDKDSIYPVRIQEEMRKQIPHSHLVVLRDTNHVSVLNNPRGVAQAILEFLRF